MARRSTVHGRREPAVPAIALRGSSDVLLGYVRSLISQMYRPWTRLDRRGHWTVERLHIARGLV